MYFPVLTQTFLYRVILMVSVSRLEEKSSFTKLAVELNLVFPFISLFLRISVPSFCCEFNKAMYNFIRLLLMLLATRCERDTLPIVSIILWVSNLVDRRHREKYNDKTVDKRVCHLLDSGGPLT